MKTQFFDSNRERVTGAQMVIFSDHAGIHEGQGFNAFVYAEAAADGFTHWRVRIGKNDSAWAIPGTVCCITANIASAASAAALIWPSVSEDSHGGMNLSTGEYTVRVAGLYSVGGSVYISSDSEAESYSLYKNGALVATIAYDRGGTSAVSTGAPALVRCVVGDVLTVRHAVAASRTFTTARTQFIRIGN